MAYYGPVLRKQKGIAPPVVLRPGLPGQSIKLSLDGVYDWVTQEKARAAALAMDSLSAKGRWPKDQKEVRGYIGRTGSGRQFNDVRGLYAYTKKNASTYYAKPLRFEPISVGDSKMLKRAADFAFRQTRSELSRHLLTGVNRDTAMYGFRSNIKAPVQYGRGDYPINRDSEFLIPVVGEYASSVEAHSYQRAKTGGMVYAAAKMTERKFPQIVVRFSYTALSDIGLPQLHNYAVPYIRLGLRGNPLKAKITRPGRNIRRRASRANRRK